MYRLVVYAVEVFSFGDLCWPSETKTWQKDDGSEKGMGLHIRLVLLLFMLSRGKENIASHDFKFNRPKTFVLSMCVHLDLDGILHFRYLVSNQYFVQHNVKEPLILGTDRYI